MRKKTLNAGMRTSLPISAIAVPGPLLGRRAHPRQAPRFCAADAHDLTVRTEAWLTVRHWALPIRGSTTVCWYSGSAVTDDGSIKVLRSRSVLARTSPTVPPSPIEPRRCGARVLTACLSHR
jgi:hypothetical protein